MKYENDMSSLKRWLIDGLKQSDDFEHRVMEANGKQAELLYLKSLCDGKIISRHLVVPFWETGGAEEFARYLLSFPGCVELDGLPAAIEKIMYGYVAVFVNRHCYLFEARNIQVSPISEATVESTVQGPQDAFNEDLMTSLTLLRTRYQTSTLQVEMHTAGEKSHTHIALVYDEQLVDHQVLEMIREQFASLQMKLVQAAGELLNHLVPKSRWNLFPTVLVTERPDRAVKQLSQGRVILVVDKTPFVLIAPSFFSDFFMSMDDQAQLNIVGRFLLALRYVGFVITLILPGLYIAVISYNPELFRVQLTFSVVASRAAVPYPSYLEVLFMLLMMEFLSEASIRLPRAIGPTATTVGGLILGQAATEAGLISNIMIIIVSLVGISNYVIPIIEMNFAVRVVKYLMVICAAVFGLPGIVLGMIGLTFYMCTLTSFGKPYIKMFRKAGDT